MTMLQELFSVSDPQSLDAEVGISLTCGHSIDCMLQIELRANGLFAIASIVGRPRHHGYVKSAWPDAVLATVSHKL